MGILLGPVFDDELLMLVVLGGAPDRASDEYR